MKRQRAKTAKEIIKLKNKVEDFYNWAYDLPSYENGDVRFQQAEAVLNVLDWILGDIDVVELNLIDAGDNFTHRINTWDDFYRMLVREKQMDEDEEDE